MRTVAIVGNALLFAVTSLIVATEGAPGRRYYQALTFLVLLVPLFSISVLFRDHKLPRGALSPDIIAASAAVVRRVGVMLNVLLFVLAGRELLMRYPYPEGNSVLGYAALVLCMPVLTIVALLRAERGAAS